MNRTTLLLLAGGLRCAACTGCGSYRAETVLHSDGSIDRAVYQHAAETPDAAQNPKLWKQVTFAPSPGDLDRTGWSEALDRLPAHAKDESHDYFVAWGHFASVKDVPGTVLINVPGGSGLPDGKMVRDLTRNDLGLVEEFDWRETLTDVVNLTDMRKARDELADLMIQFGQDVFTEVVGKDYDVSDLVQWMNKDGKDFRDDLTDTLFTMGATQKGWPANKARQEALVAVCAHHGLNLKKDGELLTNSEFNKAMNAFVVALAAEKIKKDGKAVGPEQAQKWLDELNSKDAGRFGPAIKKVADQKYGGGKALSDRAYNLLVRILGLYWTTPRGEFRYTMTFPGPVVETNGELLGTGDKVFWQFPASDAYPTGYPMMARSLHVPDDARKLIGRDGPLSDRDSMTAYADLVRGDEALTTAMRQCRETMSLVPLQEYIARQKMQDATKAAHAQKVLRLLKAP